MNAVLDPALELALACHRRPALLTGVRSRPLPDDLRLLLRLAAGDEALITQCAASHRQSPAELVEAAVFLIQQVLFAPDADSYRVLGVRPNAPDALIREHYRWLVRWQHPDRARDWDSVYADRINSAWQDLRLPEKRRAYDETAAGRARGAPVALGQGAVPVASAVWREPDDDLHRPAWFGRHLPALVLGALALAAVALLVLMWHARQARHRSEVVAAGELAPMIEAPDAIVAAAEASQADLAAAHAASTPAAMSLPGESAGPTPLLEAPLHLSAAPLPETEPSAAPLPSPVPEFARSPLPAPRPDRQAAPAPPRENALPLRETAVEVRPLPATAPSSPPVPASSPESVLAPPPIAQADAEVVMRQLRAAYASGDLSALMRLFTADAHNNRGDRSAIASDYRDLFATTQKRELELQTAGWIERGDERTLIARYRSKVKREGSWTSTRVEGLIRIDLRRDNGELKISRMVHDEDS